MKGIRLLIFTSILAFAAGSLEAVSLDGGSYQCILTADWDTGGKIPTQGIYMHEMRININGHPNSRLDVLNEVKSSWLPRLEGGQTTDVSLFDLVAWKTVVVFKSSYQFRIGFGNVFVNYSPYVFHAEEWQDAFFKGAFASIEEDPFRLHVFLAMHSESHKTNVVPMAPGIKDLGFFYNQKDYHKSVQQQPTLWGGFNASYAVSENLVFRLIYGHESFSITSYTNGQSGDYFFYNNEILQPEISWNPFPWLDLHVLAAGYLQSFQAYAGLWDYFGPGKHLMVLDYMGKNLYPAAEASLELKNPFLKNPVMATALKITFRYIDKYYQPVHMNNGTWFENRGEDFMEFLSCDRKGWIFRLVQPVTGHFRIEGDARFWDSIDGKSGQQDYRAIVRVSELFHFLDLSLTYRFQQLTGLFFSDGSDSLHSLLMKAGVGEKEKWNAELVLSVNDRDNRNIHKVQGIAKFYF